MPGLMPSQQDRQEHLEGAIRALLGDAEDNYLGDVTVSKSKEGIPGQIGVTHTIEATIHPTFNPKTGYDYIDNQAGRNY